MKLANDNLIELCERVTSLLDDDVKAELRALPQVPAEWLNPLRKMLDKTDAHPMDWGIMRKVKFAMKFKSLVKRMKTLEGMPQGSELV